MTRIIGQKALEQIAELLPCLALLYSMTVALRVVNTANYIAVLSTAPLVCACLERDEAYPPGYNWRC